MTRVILAGAGHTALVALDALRRRPIDGADITVVSGARRSAYSGTLPGFVEGLYAESDVFIDLDAVIARAGARLLVDEIVGLDADGNRLLTRDAGPLPYDLCVLNMGSRPSTPEFVADDALFLPVKPIEPFVAALPGLLDRVRSGRATRIAVVGGGPGGIELALALARRVAALAPGHRHPDVRLIEGGERLAGQLSEGFRRRAAMHLTQAGIGVMTGRTVTRVESDRLVLEDAAPVPAGAVIWATGSTPPPSLAGSGLQLAPSGFVATDRSFRSLSHPNVLAVGDVGTVVDDPRPRAGVYAVRSGKPLAEALRALAAGRRPADADLQRDALVLLSTGGRHAIASRGRFTVEGHWVWRWKDHIDRRFVTRFR